VARAGSHEFLEPEVDEAWLAVLQLNRSVLPLLDVRLRQAHGLSVSEFDVLITLWNAPERRLGMGALADSVLLSPSGLTHLVTRMERDGLIRRAADPGDGRKFFAELTPSGEETLRQSRLTHNEVVREQLLERLTRSERTTLARIWRRTRSSPRRTRYVADSS
jgi:DNA-binding MarR family transcriptional regulator